MHVLEARNWSRKLGNVQQSRPYPYDDEIPGVFIDVHSQEMMLSPFAYYSVIPGVM